MLSAPGAPYQSIGSPLDREALTQICLPGARGEAILGYLDQVKSEEEPAAGRAPPLRRAPRLRRLGPKGGDNTPTKGSPGIGGDSYSPSCYYRSKKSQGRKGQAASPQGAGGSWLSPKAHALSPSAFSTVGAEPRGLVARPAVPQRPELARVGPGGLEGLPADARVGAVAPLAS